jgi:hypothetical protein
MSRRFLIIALSAIAAIACWFLAVDRSWFIENCPTCGYSSDVMQIRVFGIPVNEQRQDHPSLIQKVAADLGAECTHPKLTGYHKHRYWGLWYCACPCINGVDRINFDISWYDEITSAKVKEMAAANPSLRKAFTERVIINRDRKYWSDFIDQLKVARLHQPN